MDTARYRAFVAVVEAGSFSRAAETLNYTASNVSQLVTALEKELDLTLLHRTKKGVRPTREGRAVLEPMRQLLEKEDLVYRVAADRNGMSGGSVVISAYPSIAMCWLPGVIQLFRKDYPHIQVRVLEGIQQNICQWLGDRSIDMGFMAYLKDTPFDWIPLAEDPMVAVLPNSHPLRDRKSISLQDMEVEELIGLPDDALFVLEDHKDAAITPLLSGQTGCSSLGLVEKGLGVCITNELYVKSLNLDVTVLPLDPPQYATLGIAVASVNELSPAARQFLDYAVRHLSRPEVYRDAAL